MILSAQRFFPSMLLYRLLDGMNVSANGIKFTVPLDNGQDNLGFEFCGVFFLRHDGDLLFDLIMPQIRA